MNRLIAAASVCLCLAACGSADHHDSETAASDGGAHDAGVDAGTSSSGFEGTFTGSVTDSLSCPGGHDESNSGEVTWTFAVSGNTLTFDFGNCPGVEASIAGNTATLKQHTCPSGGKDGTVLTPHVTGGTLVLSGSSIAVSMDTDMTLSQEGSPDVSCPGSTKGTLTRSP